MVLSSGCSVHSKMVSWMANPVTIISGPKALSGRLRHATSPARMKGSVSQMTSRTRRAGW